VEDMVIFRGEAFRVHHLIDLLDVPSKWKVETDRDDGRKQGNKPHNSKRREEKRQLQTQRVLTLRSEQQTARDDQGLVELL
ncbi:hypothetical protein INR49_032456, partial [Caranx melampygus]